MHISLICKSSAAVICMLVATSLNAECVVKGCFNEICACKDELTINLCLWKAANCCYQKYGICELNKDGICEWRPTKELQTCVSHVEARVNSIDTFSD